MIQAPDDVSNTAADPVPLPPRKKVKRTVKCWNTEAAYPVKNNKKDEDEAKAAAKKEEFLPGLTELMEPYVEGILDFVLLRQYKNKLLQDIVKYYFNASPPKLSSMKKEDLLSFIKHRLSPENATATASSTGDSATATAMANATPTTTATATATASIS